MGSKDMLLKAENMCECCESSMRFLTMFNQLSDSGKEKMLNVLNVLLKAEYVNEHKGLEGID
jgi:hypothetical protein